MDLSKKRNQDILNVFGPADSNLKMLENQYDVQITFFTNDETNIQKLDIRGGKEKVTIVKKILTTLFELSKKGKEITVDTINNAILLEKQGNLDDYEGYKNIEICKTIRGEVIYPKTKGQKQLVDTIKNNNIIFASGPAGTGKTFIAAAYAARLLKEGKIDKIYLARPNVEAGEKLGFLPGDVREKVEMYLVPLLNSLQEIFGKEQLEKYLEGKSSKSIETGAVAYMRGLTFKNTIAIIDEAQNLTSDQFKLILSRIGPNSKIIICGDTRQSDIELGPNGKTSLELLINHVKNRKSEGLYKTFATCELTTKDVVRSQECLEAIELIEEFEILHGKGIGKTKPNYMEELSKTLKEYIEVQNEIKKSK